MTDATSPRNFNNLTEVFRPQFKAAPIVDGPPLSDIEAERERRGVILGKLERQAVEVDANDPALPYIQNQMVYLSGQR